MKSTLEMLVDAAEQTGVRIMLVGGYAMQVHGVSRQTLDVDCVIADADIEKVRSILHAMQFDVIERAEQ